MADSGIGSLRQAILNANDESAHPGKDTITFTGLAVGGTVELSSIGGMNYGPNALEITSDIVIQGNSSTAETLSISSSAKPMRLFYVAPGVTLLLDRIQLTGGTAQGGMGGIGGGGGGAGMGGAIYNQGSLLIHNSTLYGNQAIGGAGGDGTSLSRSAGGGGGMYGDGGDAISVLSSGGGGGFGGNGGDGDAVDLSGGGGGTTEAGQHAALGGAGGVLNGGAGGDAGGNGDVGGGGGGGVSGGNGGIGGGGGGSNGNNAGGAGGFGGGGGGGETGGAGGYGGGGGAGFISAGLGGKFGSHGTTENNFSQEIKVSGGGGGGAGLGGAIFNDAGNVVVNNSTFSGNSAIGGAGGIGAKSDVAANSGQGVGGSLFTYGGTVQILNSTMTQGKANTGRELYADYNGLSAPFLTLENSIFGQSNLNAIDVDGKATGNATNNLIPVNRMQGINFQRTYASDPFLGPLQDNGGGILTHLPGATSVAINSGLNDVAFTLSSDQRLFKPRIVGSAIDLGAIEVGAVYPMPHVAAPGNQTAIKNLYKSFDVGVLSDLNHSSLFTITVDWGDGSVKTIFNQYVVGTISMQSHFYTDIGTYTVSVFATDIDGKSNTSTFEINVVSSPPVLKAPFNQSTMEGATSEFQLGTLTDANLSGDYTIQVNWGDESPVENYFQPTVGLLSPQSHTFVANGIYTVSVVATDIDGTSNTIHFQIAVENSPPLLTAPSDQTATEGVFELFNMGSLADSNLSGNYTVTVEWGDNSSTVFTQPQVGIMTPQSHLYQQDGNFTVLVSAVGPDGNSNTITFNVVVPNEAPTIVPAQDQSATTNLTTAFDIGSFADPSPFDSPWLVHVDFGDGTTIEFDQVTTGALPWQSHAYAKTGIYTMTVNVSDDDSTATATSLVFVSNSLGSSSSFAVGGQTSVKSVLNNGTIQYEVAPFGSSYSNSVRVAESDMTGDGVPEIIAGTGPGSVNRIQILDGVTHQIVKSLAPYEPTFTGGIFVAVGDLNSDGRAEIIVTADVLGGTRVRVFDGMTYQTLADFFGIEDSNFRGGAHAAVGDVNNDGVQDLIITAGFGGGPRVAIYDGTSVASNRPAKLINDFFALDPNFRGGLFVSAGDVNGDGYADLIFGAGIGGSPRVEVISGLQILSGTRNILANFFVGNAFDRNGVHVAAKYIDGDNLADIVTGSGQGSGSRVRAYLGGLLSPDGTPLSYLEFDAFGAERGGVFVG
ncbi:MAG: PKD domain-containing protein [Gemmataceae bacterium]